MSNWSELSQLRCYPLQQSWLDNNKSDESQSILFVMLPFGTSCRRKTKCKYRFTWSLRHIYQLGKGARYSTTSLAVKQIVYILLWFLSTRKSILRSHVIYEMSSVEWRKQYFVTSAFMCFLIINIYLIFCSYSTLLLCVVFLLLRFHCHQGGVR